jgi:hypothetical protein
MASAPELYRMKQVIPSKETGFREINNGYNFKRNPEIRC